MSQNGFGQNGLVGLIAGRLEDHRQCKITNQDVREKDQECAILLNSTLLETENRLTLKGEQKTAISMNILAYIQLDNIIQKAS